VVIHGAGKGFSLDARTVRADRMSAADILKALRF